MKARRRGWWGIVTVLTSVVVFPLLMPCEGHAQAKFWREGPSLREPDSDLSRLNRSLTRLAALIRPAVVQIGVERGEQERVPENHPPLPEERPDRPRVGSGFILSPDGYILTNDHVVGEAAEVEVELFDGRTVTAKVVGRDGRTDLALLKVEVTDPLPVLPLGDSDRLEIGELVIAAGNPFGLEHTVTVGMVSRKGHGYGRFGFFDDYIQTDASISPGNSGGPLVNIRGEVVGVNTAIIPRQRIGFAVPINLAKSILPQLRDKGKVVWGFLGVGIQDLSPPLAEAFGLATKGGALVTNVLSGRAAEKAGLKRGDVILEFDGTSVKDVRHLQRMVARAEVGREVALKVLRQGETRTLTATVGEFTPELVASREGAPAPPPKEVFGLTLEELTPETAKKFKLSEQRGVVVAEVTQGSPAAEAGIRPGDLLAEVDQQEVKTLQDVRQAIKRWGRATHLFLIKRGEGYLYVAIKGKG